MPAILSMALSRYICAIPALQDLPNPPPETVYKRYYGLGECAFLHKQIAESKDCDGLQLFRDTRATTTKETFCQNKLGINSSVVIVAIPSIYIHV